MAVNVKKGTVENKVELGFGMEENVTARVENESKGGFGMKSSIFSKFMKFNMGSEYTNKIKDKLAEILREQNEFSYKIFVFDNTSGAYNGWPYSFIVPVLFNNKTKKAFYVPLLLEATGRGPVDIRQVLEIDPQRGFVKIKDQSALFMPSDYFNDIVLGEIEKVIQTNLPDREVTYVDGEIIPSEADIDKIGFFVALDVYNGAFVYELYTDGDFVDLYAGELVEDKSYQLFEDVVLNVGNGINRLGRVTALDFNIKLQLRKQSNNQLPTMMNYNRNIGDVTGYIEQALVVQKDIMGNTIRKGVPVIIVNDIDTEYPTLGYTLLNLANTAVFGHQNILLNALYNKPNIGALNYIVNVEKAQEFGKKVNLKDTKYTIDKAFAFLSKMFIVNNYAVAFETELNGREYFKTSVFAALVDRNAWKSANDFIVSTAEQLTGSNFENRTVFTYAIEVPVGTWVDANGNIRDIREIDLSTICSLTNDINLIQKWLLSNEDPATSGIDPFITKLEVLLKLGIDAKVENKAVRVMMNPGFMSELITKLQSIGINPVVNANAIQTTAFIDMASLGTSSITAAMLNAQFGAMPGFGNNYNIQNFGRFSGFFR